MKNPATSLILRLGLAYLFLYAGIDGLREPAVWVDYVPNVLPNLVSQMSLLDFASFLQIAVALFLLWKPMASYAALIGVGLLLGITFGNLAAFLVVFRDLALAFMALAVVVEEWPYRLNLFRGGAKPANS